MRLDPGTGQRLLPEDDRIRDRLLMNTWPRKNGKRRFPCSRKKRPEKADMETLNDLLTCYGALKDQGGDHSRTLNRLLKLRPDDLQTRERLAEILEERRKEWDKAAKAVRNHH
jgi:hypothetical protein